MPLCPCAAYVPIALCRSRRASPIGDGLAEELEKRALFLREADAHDGTSLASLAQRFERAADHVVVEQSRADVRGAANCRRVAELLGGCGDRFSDAALSLGLARGLTL